MRPARLANRTRRHRRRKLDPWPASLIQLVGVHDGGQRSASTTTALSELVCSSHHIDTRIARIAPPSLPDWPLRLRAGTTHSQQWRWMAQRTAARHLLLRRRLRMRLLQCLQLRLRLSLRTRQHLATPTEQLPMPMLRWRRRSWHKQLFSRMLQQPGRRPQILQIQPPLPLPPRPIQLGSCKHMSNPSSRLSRSLNRV